MRLFLNSFSAIFVTRSFSFSIANIFASRVETVHSVGISMIRKSLPLASSSSSFPRSAVISCMVFFVTRKFKREFRRLKSRSFLSHMRIFVTGLSLPSATLPRSELLSSEGASISFGLSDPSASCRPE